jgi:hypothetical protein
MSSSLGQPYAGLKPRRLHKFQNGADRPSHDRHDLETHPHPPFNSLNVEPLSTKYPTPLRIPPCPRTAQRSNLSRSKHSTHNRCRAFRTQLALPTLPAHKSRTTRLCTQHSLRPSIHTYPLTRFLNNSKHLARRFRLPCHFSTRSKTN